MSRRFAASPGQHKRADTTARRAAEGHLFELQRRAAHLHAECCMCGAAWDRLAEIWRHYGLQDRGFIAADKASDKTEELAADMLKRDEVGDALRRAQYNAEFAAVQRQIALLQAAERVRLATRHEVAGARTDS